MVRPPKILTRLERQLAAKGKDPAAAAAIATKALQKAGDLKPGTQEATAKGKARGEMTPGARAKDRASKISGHDTGEYNYDAKTNRATLKGSPK
jgi:hypothetical protein